MHVRARWKGRIWGKRNRLSWHNFFLFHCVALLELFGQETEWKITLKNMLGNGGRFTVILQVGHEVNHIIITCRSCFRLELVFVRYRYIYIHISAMFCRKMATRTPRSSIISWIDMTMQFSHSRHTVLTVALQQSMSEWNLNGHFYCMPSLHILITVGAC